MLIPLRIASVRAQNSGHSLFLPAVRTVGVWICFTVLWLPILTATASSQILSFKTYSVKDGLASNDIEAIAQDRSGRMWFGTTDGASVFDGQRFTNFTTLDGLPGNFVNQVLPDRDASGVVWIVTGEGLCRFNNGRITPFPLPAGVVTMVHQDSAGMLWCGTTVGVFTVKGDSVARFGLPELNDQIERIAEVGDSVLWFAHGALLISYTRATGRFARLDCAQFGNGSLWRLFVDGSGMLYAVMGDGVVVRIRDGRVVDSRTIPALPIDVGAAADGSLWFGGYGGITTVPATTFADASLQHLTTANGLPENTVRRLFVDREQNLWIGGRDKGLAKLSTGAAMRFPLGYIWYWHHHRIAVADSSSHLWIVSNHDLLEVWHDRFQIWHSVQHGLYRGPVPLPEHMHGAVGAVALDGKGRLWVTRPGPDAAVECYDIVRGRDALGNDDQPALLKRRSTFLLGSRMPGVGLHPIMATRSGEIWTGAHGLARLDPESTHPVVRIYSAADGIPENYVRELYEDRKGNVWVGSLADGAIRISADGTIRRFTTAEGLPDNAVWTFAEDQDGRMVIGTSNGGLATLDGDSVTVLTQRGGLPSNKILCATFDATGRLWLGTSIGLVYEDHPGSRSFIKNQAFLGSGVHAVGTTRSGLLWFITPTDMWVYDPAHDKSDTIPPPVYITELVTNGVERVITPTMSFSHDESNCKIGFVGISFKDEGAVRYRYRLLGAGPAWHGPTYDHSITYGNLNPGSYAFEVKAINVDGTESVMPATIAFTIAPPYWETWPFRAVATAVLLSAALLLYYRRVSVLNAARVAQQEFSRQLIASQESERRRVAGELHDDLGQELMVIINRAQLGLKAQSLEAAKGQLAQIVETTAQSIESVREIAFNLSPQHLEQLGLTESLRTMVEKVAAIPGIAFSFHADAIDELLTSEQEMNVYRIVQECVNNVGKHSSASEAEVGVHVRDGMIEVIVSDDGKGFDISQAALLSHAQRGFGLTGLSERVKLLDGTLTVESSPGRGTTVTVRIPCGGRRIPPSRGGPGNAL